MKLSTVIIAGMALAGASVVATAASAVITTATIHDQYGYADGGGDNGTLYVSTDFALTDVTIGGQDFGALAAGASTGPFIMGDCEGGCSNGTYTVTINDGSGLPTGANSASFTDSLGDADDYSGVVLGTLQVGTAVPEPAAWALMLVGVAGLGGALRRSRGSAVTA